MRAMPLRLGLAGLGIHGARYAEHLLRGDVPRAALAAVSRQDAAAGKSFAAGHGIAFVEDPRELAEHPAVDAVIAVLPPDLHPGVARACLARGKPVLIEKPLAADAASAAEIAALVRETGVPLMVAHTLRFDPLVRRLKELAATLGPLRLLAINQRFEPTDRVWIDRPGPGGALLNTAVHGFDLMRFLTGAEADSIDAQVETVVTARTEDEVGGAGAPGPRPHPGHPRQRAHHRGTERTDRDRGRARPALGRPRASGPLPCARARAGGSRPGAVRAHGAGHARRLRGCPARRDRHALHGRGRVQAVRMAEAARRSAETGQRAQLADVSAGVPPGR
jgi:predicted dehydrogenase